jgi:hypothetical protein
MNEQPGHNRMEYRLGLAQNQALQIGKPEDFPVYMNEPNGPSGF